MKPILYIYKPSTSPLYIMHYIEVEKGKKPYSMLTNTVITEDGYVKKDKDIPTDDICHISTMKHLIYKGGKEHIKLWLKQHITVVDILVYGSGVIREEIEMECHQLPKDNIIHHELVDISNMLFVKNDDVIEGVYELDNKTYYKKPTRPLGLIGNNTYLYSSSGLQFKNMRKHSYIGYDDDSLIPKHDKSSVLTVTITNDTDEVVDLIVNEFNKFDVNRYEYPVILNLAGIFKPVVYRMIKAFKEKALSSIVINGREMYVKVMELYDSMKKEMIEIEVGKIVWPPELIITRLKQTEESTIVYSLYKDYLNGLEVKGVEISEVTDRIYDNGTLLLKPDKVIFHKFNSYNIPISLNITVPNKNIMSKFKKAKVYIGILHGVGVRYFTIVDDGENVMVTSSLNLNVLLKKYKSIRL